ncbi:hypothetical protein PENANT_c009G04964 [Penicillium antarcticum]|uniref:Zn(2)-C6 fungal-type domain-containing protein n=1 Tax=Penicillium antarcticum TaxID=416450 RepID=A0A1V6Q9H6_9EURO|nr:hypothetical protein PENANT_c009G04964 [Penicillium antarcticum]
MDFTALHRLQDPGIIKASKRQGRRPGKSACAACHARKKRCDISPPSYQCTHCRKEGQVCISRDPIERYHSIHFMFSICLNVGTNIGPRHVRPTRHRISNSHPNKLASNNDHDNDNNNNVSDDEYSGNILPFPKGIDHEIPRWSAAFSMFSEMRRLLAPPSPESEEDCAEEEGEGDEVHDSNVTGARVKEDKGNERGIERKEHVSFELGSGEHSRGILDDTFSDGVCIKGISIPASDSVSQSPASSGRPESGSVLAACRTEIMHGDLPSMGDVRVSGHDTDARVFMDDLDALLRF